MTHTPIPNKVGRMGKGSQEVLAGRLVGKEEEGRPGGVVSRLIRADVLGWANAS